MSRRAHYRHFYDGFCDGAERDGRPLGFVHGNCQAEALRVVLAGSPTFPWQLVRVPPVHELEAADLPALGRLAGASSLLLAQPVRAGYRGLPLGTGELALEPAARVVRWPVVRDAGLHPFSAIVRVPDGAEPPLVPYHDLRTLTGRRPAGPDLVAAAAHSRTELARRERRDTDVAVSDLLPGLGAEAVHTLNHPGNGLLVALARRVQEALGVPADAADPGRVLLGGVRAPLEPAVLQALGLDPGAARPHWLVSGTPLADADVVAAQRAWYATRPDVVQAGLERYRDRLPLLGLGQAAAR